MIRRTVPPRSARPVPLLYSFGGNELDGSNTSIGPFQARRFRLPQTHELPDPGSPVRRQAEPESSGLDRRSMKRWTPLRSDEPGYAGSRWRTLGPQGLEASPPRIGGPPSEMLLWSGRRDSNPRPSPWQGGGIRARGYLQSSGLRMSPSSFHPIHRIRLCCRAVYYERNSGEGVADRRQ
jgi:hypothetical protein